MKKYLLIAFALFLVFLGQTVLSKYFPRAIFYLDLFLVIVVYYSLKENPIEATLIGTFAGLIQDTFSSGIIGFSSFSKTIIGFFLSSVNTRIMLHHPFAQITVLFLATLLNGLMLKGLSLFFGLNYIPQLFPSLLYQALANGFVGIIIIRLMFAYSQKKQKKLSC